MSKNKWKKLPGIADCIDESSSWGGWSLYKWVDLDYRWLFHLCNPIMWLFVIKFPHHSSISLILLIRPLFVFVQPGHLFKILFSSLQLASTNISDFHLRVIFIAPSFNIQVSYSIETMSHLLVIHFFHLCLKMCKIFSENFIEPG